MQGSIVEQGVELMLFGMGTVVVFLTLLILATNVMSLILRRFFPEPEVPIVSPALAPASAPQAVDQTRLLAVISAAIHRHRAHKK
jgi:oxaloacetate decarboxylase (Na+ extruding) subunit gamma